jgi:hypothetical protein
MPAAPAFINDKLELVSRKCVVFPADGSETRLVHMVVRTVTTEDITSLKLHSRCVDLISTFGDEHRKTQVSTYKGTHDGTYLLFYNLSLALPINLNVARDIGVSPSHLKSKKRMFWRGDVVAMKVRPESEMKSFIIESLDADLFDLDPLLDFSARSTKPEVWKSLSPF